MKKEQQGDLKEGLNLGLSDLLSTSEESSNKENQPREINFVLIPKNGAAASAEMAEGPDLEKPAKTLEVDPYRELANAGDWLKLNLLCEKNLVQDPQNTAVKIWWLKAQLELNSVPLSILAAPVESAFEDFEKKKGDEKEKGCLLEISHLLAEILLRCGQHLFNNDEREIGLEFLRRAADLSSENVKLFSDSLRYEIESLNSATGRADKQNNKDKLSKLQSLLDHYQPREHPARVEETLSSGITPAVTSAATSSGAFKRIFGFLSRQQFLRLHARTIFAVCLTSVIFAVAFAIRSLQPTATQLALLNLEVPDTNASLELPELEAVTNLSNLGAKFYDLENEGVMSPPHGQIARAPKQGSTPQIQARAGEADTTSGPQQNRPAQREVDTSYPPEPQELRQASRSSAAEILEGYHVQLFSNETHYIVTARTVIRSRPSHFGIAVGDLERGDRVLAEAMVGPWIRLRSYSGAPGYIMAENAERLS
jgi:hypothetical protein